MTPADDPYDLARFVTAQAPVFDQALAELRAGAKRSHWMWFIFPQLRALGRSPTAQRYGISDADEARAYLAHPVLGPRLVGAVETATAAPAASLHALFGSPDDLKFRSCVTLFGAVSGVPVFQAALDRWCGGMPDPATRDLLA